MITALELENFKTFRSANIPFGHLTFLSGVNGSGKSTVLQSLAVVKQSHVAGVFSSRGGLLLNGDLVELGVGRDVLFEGSSSQTIRIKVTTESSTNDWAFSYGERDDLLAFAESLPPVFVVPGWLGQGFQFLKADRISPAVVYPKSYATIRHRNLGVRGEFTPHFLAAAQDSLVSQRRCRDDTSSSRLLDQVNGWLSQITPGAIISASEIRGADLAQIHFTIGGRAGIDSSNPYRPTNVGFGLTYVLPILVACLAAFPGDLLLLENPEAHLHPKGQVIIAELLARAAADGVQVVVESHSDHLLNGIRLAVKRNLLSDGAVKLHFFTRNGELGESEFTTPQVSRSGRINSWPPGFFDEWENSLLDLI